MPFAVGKRLFATVRGGCQADWRFGLETAGEAIQDVGMYRPIFALVLVPALALAAAPVGYAQATGYLKKSSRPTLYQPLNLLDGREITAWCSTSGDPLADSITFGFKAPVRIDEVRVYTGNGFDDDSFKQFARAKKFILKTPTGETSFTVSDHRGLQPVTLNPPLTSARFELDIVDTYPPEDPEQPICVTDVVFFSGGKPLNGPWLTQKLKFDRQRAPFLGTWFAGYPGAADRFLSFFFDSSFHYSYEPFDPANNPHAFSGKYQPSTKRIVLEIPGKGRVSAAVKFGRAKDDSGHSYRTLTLSGKGLPADLEGTFREKP